MLFISNQNIIYPLVFFSFIFDISISGNQINSIRFSVLFFIHVLFDRFHEIHQFKVIIYVIDGFLMLYVLSNI